MDTNTYTYLEPVGNSGPSIDTSNPEAYFALVYNTVITITVAIALIMIVVAGIQYTTTWASPSSKEAAKSRITGAIGGLILAFISYILLSTINPDLLKVVIPK